MKKIRVLVLLKQKLDVKCNRFNGAIPNGNALK